MGLFDKIRKGKASAVDFSHVDTEEKVMELARNEMLAPLYMMPLRFNGEESAGNRLFVPPFAVALKDRYDDMVEKLLVEGKVNGYACSPSYRGNSRVPSQIEIVAKKDGQPVFTETIHIW